MKIFLTILAVTAAVLGGLIALIIIAVLIILPVRAELIAGYNDDEKFFLRVKYSSFVLNIIPGNRSSSKKAKPDSSGKESEKNSSEKKKNKGLFARKLRLMHRNDYLMLLGYVRDSVKHMRFGEIFANLIVATEDAAATASYYGALNALIFPLIGKIHNDGKANNISVHINADFATTKTFADIYTEVYLRTVHAVALFFKVIIYILKLKEKDNGK